MNSPPMRTFLPWTSVGLALLAGAIAWGTTAQKVQALEDAQSTAETDHDSIVTMQAQMSRVEEDVKETKEATDDIQQTMNDNFREIMIELRTRPTPSD